ncbi:MAG: M6 family metalloprotease domain-containing protein [Bacteroidales bacterium]|nr:M6 family metalloprotease domain-containing protein [Candidatus Latescibacterota bacterium]
MFKHLVVSAVMFSIISGILLVPTISESQIYPPKDGNDYPKAYYERIRQDKTAFQFQKAWIQKAERASKNRRELIREYYYKLEKARLSGLTGLVISESQNDLRSFLSSRPVETAVAGNTSVPIFMVKFTNTGADPYPNSNLQTELFDGPWPTGTMSEFFSEISYGNFNLDGTVYDWFELSDYDTFYEGTENGLGGDSKVGQLILETLNNWDASVNFAQYDNDGPDGIPNSGDDDGYVDFVSFVHAEIGGECGTTNLWSHRWVVTGWPEFSAPYATNDARSGGGVIRIYDYTIQPALSCGGSMIEIGVYCHEFGHAFGLPDLYDTNGGSAGVGHWGLMGSGSWNEPESPAHMCAWSKSELGWILPVEVGPFATAYDIYNIEFNNDEGYRLNVMEENWRRLTDCAIGGSYAMHCGLTSAEATSRGWPGGAGYGNSWDELVSREFSYNGSGSVNLSYDFVHHSEPGYDETIVSIVVNSIEYELQAYDGPGSGTESIDLTPHLSGSGASSYEIKFRFTSDSGWSDADGSYNTTCGAFTFDNVSLTGGGESYSADFESYEDGWHVDSSNPREFFLIENRQAMGFDAYVHGSGLAIWHVDNNISGNTGGDSDDQPHMVTLEEADGLEHLMDNTNRGDAGDIYPGSSSNTSFGSSTTPNSYNNNGNPTNVEVTMIGLSGNPMTATMKGGWFAPTLTSVLPDSGYTDGGEFSIDDILGGGINYGASFYLSNGSDPDIPASSVEWVGHAKLTGTIDLAGASSGYYDFVVENPDGQTVVLAGAFQVIDTTVTDSEIPDVPGEFALSQNVPNPFNPITTIAFDIASDQQVSLKIYDVQGRLIRTLVNEYMPARSHSVRWDGKNERGTNVASGVYFYQLQAGSEYRAVKKLVLMR